VDASLQAPVLFVIANDLTRMQVNASIDEADIGRVKAGQEVTFRVDAFPDETFRGRLEQVRLQPVTAQNVVTYNTIVAVDNKGQRLMPGMTATVSVIVDERKNALRLPAAALRFRPDGFEEGRRSPAGPGTGARGEGPAGVVPAGGDGSRGGPERASRIETRDQSPKGNGRPGLVFIQGEDGRPKPTRVRLGLSDGRFVEVLEGLEEGATVVTGVEEAGRPRTPGPSPSGANNPFQPPRFNPRPRQ
jgi:HlyD family secretion protein